MKKFKVLVNTRTSGKFKREEIDGRSHLVTIMMPIRGDITMNRKFYPDEQVTNSFMQLNMLPAPHGHPTVNGVSVPAFHPVANNKHNIGGFLRNPRKKGKRVFVDFMLDEEIANNSDEGKETIRRIEAGEKIGVSTGLTIDMVVNKTGKDDFGKDFHQEVSGYNFDHVAILLNEAAAGDHAGTELVLNEEGEKIHVSNLDLECNEVSTSEMHQELNTLVRAGLSDGSFAWVHEIFPDSKTFVFSIEQRDQKAQLFKQSFAIDQNDVFSLLGDRKEVVEKKEFIDKPTQTFNNDEDHDMDKLSVILAIIGNSANSYGVSDKDQLMAMSDADLNQVISTNTDEDGAKAILTNSGFDFAGYEAYQTNKAGFEVFQASEETKLTELKTAIVANSEYTPEMLEGKNSQELTILNSMIKPAPKTAVRIAEGHQTQIQTNAASDAGVVDFT